MTDEAMTDEAAIAWKCSGCGILSPGRLRSCDCLTNVVSCGQFRDWKIERMTDKPEGSGDEWEREMFRRLRWECQDHLLGSSEVNMALVIIDDIERVVATLRTQLSTVTRERDEAREGLKPFAEAAADFGPHVPDHEVICGPSLGDLRRAAGILDREG